MKLTDGRSQANGHRIMLLSTGAPAVTFLLMFIVTRSNFPEGPIGWAFAVTFGAFHAILIDKAFRERLNPALRVVAVVGAGLSSAVLGILIVIAIGSALGS